MLRSGSKSLYHHVDYGRDHCHWLHRKRKLWYTPRNPPPRFLCLELLCLSAWQLHLHQLSLVSSPFNIGGCLLSKAFCTPSIRCLCNSSLSILACIGKVFACCLHQEHKRLHVVQQLLHSLCSKLHLGKLLLLALVVSLQYLVESRVSHPDIAATN